MCEFGFVSDDIDINSIFKQSKNFFEKNYLLIGGLKSLCVKSFEVSRIYSDMKKYLYLGTPWDYTKSTRFDYLKLGVWRYDQFLLPFKIDVKNYENLIDFLQYYSIETRTVEEFMRKSIYDDCLIIIENNYGRYLDRYAFSFESSHIENMDLSSKDRLNYKLIKFCSLVHYCLIRGGVQDVLIDDSVIGQYRLLDIIKHHYKAVIHMPERLLPYAYLIKESLSSTQIACALNKSHRTVEAAILKLREIYDLEDKTLLSRYLDFIL